MIKVIVLFFFNFFDRCHKVQNMVYLCLLEKAMILSYGKELLKMIHTFIKSLFLIFMAEMGDKTQILAMAFATQYKIEKVLLGVFIGSLLNHGLAVSLGSYLSNIIPINLIQMIAGFSFVAFALWTLKSDEEDEEENVKNNFGPVLTVATAFFIGELGDKTQLTAITLAVDARAPLFVLMGTVSGMVLTSGMGIFIGSKIGDRVPEFTIKLVSASIFMFFGITKLYTTLPEAYINPINVIIFFIVIGISVYILLKPAMEARKMGESSLFKETAITLYEYTHNMQEVVEDLCLGTGNCGKCEGQYCIIGYTKKILENEIKNEEYITCEDYEVFSESLKKNFKRDKVIDGLRLTIDCLKEQPKEYKDNLVINKVRNVFEMLLLGETLNYEGSLEKYFKVLEEKDAKLASEIKSNFKKI